MAEEMDALRLRIERLMKERRRSARSLSLAIGQNSAYIQQLISGMRNKKPPSIEIMESIARELDVSLDVLRGRGEAMLSPTPASFLRLPLPRLLKALGAVPSEDDETEFEHKVSAGKGSTADDRRHKSRLYIIEVEGDCMVPEITSGDRVKFDPELDPEDGDWVVATIEGEKAIIKQLEVRGAVQRLLPLNGEPLVIDENVRIVGVVLYHEKPGPRGRRRR